MIDIIALAKRPRRGSVPSARVQEDQPDEGDGTARDSLVDEPRDEYSDVEKSALDDVAEILGVQEQDRKKFDSALEDLIEACAKRAMNGDDNS